MQHIIGGRGKRYFTRKKEVKPIELVEAAIKRIERINPQINAVVTRMYDLARKDAASDLPDVPLTGVPFLLKDLQAAHKLKKRRNDRETNWALRFVEIANHI